MTQDATDIVRLLGGILKSAASRPIEGHALSAHAEHLALKAVGNAMIEWANDDAPLGKTDQLTALKEAIGRAEADSPRLTMLLPEETTRIVQVPSPLGQAEWFPPALHSWAYPQPGMMPSAAEEREVRNYIRGLLNTRVGTAAGISGQAEFVTSPGNVEFVQQGGVGMVTCKHCGRSDVHDCGPDQTTPTGRSSAFDGCPHCGSMTADVQCVVTSDKIHPYQVRCVSCGCQTAHHGDISMAWKSWRGTKETGQ